MPLCLARSTACREPIGAYLPAPQRAGFVWRAHNTERTKRYFREAGAPRTHLHVRRAGSFGEQLVLLLRDYLRAHRPHAEEYATLKYRLAEQYRDNAKRMLRRKDHLGAGPPRRRMGAGHRLGAGSIRCVTSVSLAGSTGHGRSETAFEPVLHAGNHRTVLGRRCICCRHAANQGSRCGKIPAGGSRAREG